VGVLLMLMLMLMLRRPRRRRREAGRGQERPRLRQRRWCTLRRARPSTPARPPPPNPAARSLNVPGGLLSFVVLKSTTAAGQSMGFRRGLFAPFGVQVRRGWRVGGAPLAARAPAGIGGATWFARRARRRHLVCLR
jgi:hypothetical protein